MQNPKTFFEQWLEEILKSNPYYKFNIVCNYYDDCQACPMCPKGHHQCDSTQAMAHLMSSKIADHFTAEGDIENDN